MNKHIVAVDIGNTNTDIGLIDKDSLTCLKRSSCPSDHNSITIIKEIEKFYHDHSIEKGTSVIICSVVELSQESVESALSTVGIGNVIFFKYHGNFPFQINYKKPESLGSDRIANCLFGLQKYPQENLIIIDVGTAVTVDVLTAKQEFLGGFIFTGLKTQLNSLHNNTSKLPYLEYSIDTISIPPDSTQDAMVSGTNFSVTGGISFIVKQIIQSTKKDFKILSCGGGWKSIENMIDFKYKFIESLTLVGVGLFE